MEGNIAVLETWSQEATRICLKPFQVINCSSYFGRQDATEAEKMFLCFWHMNSISGNRRNYPTDGDLEFLHKNLHCEVYSNDLPAGSNPSALVSKQLNADFIDYIGNKHVYTTVYSMRVISYYELFGEKKVGIKV